MVKWLRTGYPPELKQVKMHQLHIFNKFCLASRVEKEQLNGKAFDKATAASREGLYQIILTHPAKS
jgi:hypothetical protein